MPQQQLQQSPSDFALIQHLFCQDVSYVSHKSFLKAETLTLLQRGSPNYLVMVQFPLLWKVAEELLDIPYRFTTVYVQLTISELVRQVKTNILALALWEALLAIVRTALETEENNWDVIFWKSCKMQDAWAVKAFLHTTSSLHTSEFKILYQFIRTFSQYPVLCQIYK